ncbi:aminotransferase class I/II-fold pyridoxal phosphate-dependent enzyme [Heliorestis acidaminivorans]|uniref:Aminotransferase n=1 Tax=Heliorestis acidaminivorans TaxID=553427 RepID=A0A6I0F5M4_9FIRM|nr:aminotransferase class I/II-fold pyridoxal phosphate-dependent enzyme [Heliorestis acidaminivorans]KAB2954137.1 aminotransferase class I/II-fold pyridoxal phosphate-dependent enzyme [Heliorestis acidaminivorans]
MRTAREYVNPVIENLPPSGIRRFFDLVANTKGVISLGVGEPDFVTPWHIREACFYGLERGYTMYTSNFGMPELRKEISSFVEKNYEVAYEPLEETLVTVGASEAVDLAMRALLVAGEEVLVPEPCYVSYAPTVTMAGGIPIQVPTYVEDDFQLTSKALEAKVTDKTKLLVLCYPNNPTGAIMARDELLEIARFVEKHDLLVLADEIYADMTYEGKHQCFAALPGMRDRTILINGFSKNYAMTGWRIGYACGHAEFIAQMTKIHQYTILCAPIMGQMAALEALKNGQSEKERMLIEYDQRRRFVVGRFNQIGLHCFTPRGAFYAFPSIKATGLTSEEFCEKLLKEEQVAVVPGNAFGTSGEGFIRVSYASSMANLTAALDRIEAFVQRYKG